MGSVIGGAVTVPVPAEVLQVREPGREGEVLNVVPEGGVRGGGWDGGSITVHLRLESKK